MEDKKNDSKKYEDFVSAVKEGCYSENFKASAFSNDSVINRSDNNIIDIEFQNVNENRVILYGLS